MKKQKPQGYNLLLSEWNGFTEFKFQDNEPLPETLIFNNAPIEPSDYMLQQHAVGVLNSLHAVSKEFDSRPTQESITSKADEIAKSFKAYPKNKIFYEGDAFNKFDEMVYVDHVTVFNRMNNVHTDSMFSTEDYFVLALMLANESLKYSDPLSKIAAVESMQACDIVANWFGAYWTRKHYKQDIKQEKSEQTSEAAKSKSYVLVHNYVNKLLDNLINQGAADLTVRQVNENIYTQAETEADKVSFIYTGHFKKTVNKWIRDHKIYKIICTKK